SKKTLSFFLALCIFTSLSITAFAEDTAISANVFPTYTVTIPDTVELDSVATIKAENILTEASKAVKVAVTATNQAGNAFAVSTNDNAVISYQLKKGTSVMKIGDVMSFEQDGTEQLTFEKLASNKLFAGQYSGTVTFTISYETINN
ncbi:MAG: hypothetical protein RRZ68_07540, partial [Oscillospiraceae bacterium]